METTVNERIKQLLQKKGISANALSKAIGMPQVTVNNYVLGRRKVSFELIEKIAVTYPDVNRAWLLTGEGEMLMHSDVTPVPLDDEPATPYTENSNGIRFLKQGDQLMIEVPLVQHNALGSPEDEYAALLTDREGGEVRLFPVEKVHHGKYFAFEVDGDSMDDGTRRSFGRGDIVLVRELDRDDWAPQLHIRDWPYWVVCWGNNVRLKQITQQTGDTITLHSINPSPEYTDFTLKLPDIHRLFNVIRLQPKETLWR